MPQKAQDPTYPDIESMTFEAALNELQKLSEKMSQGTMPLAESVDAYSRGVALTQHCQKLLNDAKEKIRICDSELKDVMNAPNDPTGRSDPPFSNDDDDSPI